MDLATEIKSRLQLAFAPTLLELRNDSAKHAGHAGDDGTGESHWHLKIASAKFADMSRIARHRAIHVAIGADIMSRIHALGIEIG